MSHGQYLFVHVIPETATAVPAGAPHIGEVAAKIQPKINTGGRLELVHYQLQVPQQTVDDKIPFYNLEFRNIPALTHFTRGKKTPKNVATVGGALAQAGTTDQNGNFTPSDLNSNSGAILRLARNAKPNALPLHLSSVLTEHYYNPYLPLCDVGQNGLEEIRIALTTPTGEIADFVSLTLTLRII